MSEMDAIESKREDGRDDIWPIVCLVVFVSIVVHGISATPLAIRFGRH